jgi:hypothetical protein
MEPAAQKTTNSPIGKYLVIVLVILGVVAAVVGWKTRVVGPQRPPVTQPADLAVPPSERSDRGSR